MRRFIPLSLVIVTVALILTLSACRSGGSNSVEQRQNQPLRIGYLSETAFDQRYANLLSREFPGLRFEIVPLMPLVQNRISLDEWDEQNKVDLIYVPGFLFEPMIDHGMLQNLDAFLADDDSFTLDAFLPSTIRLSELYGQGSLYGIVPSFYSSAIAYNRSIFGQSGVSIPEAHFAWEDLLLLAQRFERGLTVIAPSPFHWIWEIGRTHQLKIIDEQTNQLLFRQPAWKKIWELATESLREGHVRLESENEFAFLSGDWAMAVLSYEQYKKLERSSPPFEWSLTSMPTDPANPGQSPYFVADGFWAIYRNADQPQAAWEVLKFFLSENTAKWEYRSNYGFSSLKSVVSTLQTEQERLAAFYEVEPVPLRNDIIPDSLPELADSVITEILENGLSVEEGILQLDKLASESRITALPSQ